MENGASSPAPPAEPTRSDIEAIARKVRERADVDELRDRLYGLKGGKELDDWTLARFVRARPKNLDESEIMIKEFITWRENYRPQEIVNDKKVIEVPLNAGAAFWHKHDKQERPCVIIKAALHKTSDTTTELTERCCAYLLEKGIHKLQQMPTTPTTEKQCVVIYDMQNFSWAKNLDTTSMFKLGKMQDYYPELLATCYIVNVGWLFKVFWRILASMVTPTTLDKIKVISDTEELLEYFDADCLLPEHGGDSDFVYSYSLLPTYDDECPDTFQATPRESLKKNKKGKKRKEDKEDKERDKDKDKERDKDRDREKDNDREKEKGKKKKNKKQDKGKQLATNKRSKRKDSLGLLVLPKSLGIRRSEDVKSHLRRKQKTEKKRKEKQSKKTNTKRDKDKGHKDKLQFVADGHGDAVEGIGSDEDDDGFATASEGEDEEVGGVGRGGGTVPFDVLMTRLSCSDSVLGRPPGLDDMLIHSDRGAGSKRHHTLQASASEPQLVSLSEGDADGFQTASDGDDNDDYRRISNNSNDDDDEESLSLSGEVSCGTMSDNSSSGYYSSSSTSSLQKLPSVPDMYLEEERRIAEAALASFLEKSAHQQIPMRAHDVLPDTP